MNNTTGKIRWGIIGPGAIANNYAMGLQESESGELTAIASRSSDRLTAFGDKYGIAADKRYESYDALCNDPNIDAVHISTPHPFHAEQALRAIQAGKHVSVEKPLALNAAEATALVEAAAQHDVFLREAYMYLHHPQIAKLVDILKDGDLGKIHHIRAVFGFAASFNPDSRLYSLELAGGGILDVGGYPVSAARMIAGIQAGQFADPIEVRGTGHLAKTGVDDTAYALLKFANGITAELACSVSTNLGQVLEISCEKGKVALLNPWVPGRDGGPSDSQIVVTRDGLEEIIDIRDERMLFAFEAEDASKAIMNGDRAPKFPAMSPAASIGNATVLDAWRKELGYVTFAESPDTIRKLSGLIPEGLPKLPKIKLDGVPNPVDKLIMGCDNRNNLAEGAIVWDAWAEAGGRSFDTAFVYGGGLHETVLGHWIKTRGVAKELTVVVKGAHSPYCLPDVIGTQLTMSLERLQLDFAPIYIMHRDNPDVPVGEFVEAVAREIDAGRIGIWGGSNWGVARFDEACAYAKEHGLTPPTILNNNLSLAQMTKPVWDGCVTSNTPETLTHLRQNKIIHLSWSSQARGYFLPEELRNRLPADTRPDLCFGGADNEKRRARAEELAVKYEVSPNNIATAWVLAQDFPSFALIGPRSPGEIATTLPALGVSLTEDEVAWLNLEA